jgi:GNAT superfamily N-acetyltransferase
MVELGRLEACEMAAFTDFLQAAPTALARRAGIAVHCLQSGVALVASVADVLALNRVLGVGLNGGISEEDVRDIITIFGAAHVPRFFVQVPPGEHQKTIGALLQTNGFRHFNNWVRLYRPLDDVPSFAGGVDTLAIDSARGREFGDVASQAFGWPQAIAETLAQTVGRGGWRHYIVEDGGQVMATAAFYEWDGFAWFDFAATREAYRRRGAQQALLDKRLCDAQARGCRGALVEAAEPAKDKDTPSYRNLIRLGFQDLYRRPNYIYEFGS